VNAAGSGTPSGNVTVSDGAGNNCTAFVATGSCSLSFATAGAKTLTATYAGDSNFNGSTSSGASHTVNKADTTTSITSDTPDPSVVGQSVTVDFTVISTAGTPSGNVTVSDGAGNNCTASVATGSCTLSFATAGSKTLTATYEGDTNFNGSASSGASHTVNKADTTTTITSDTPDPSAYKQSVTVNFGVSVSAPGSGTPTGDVTVSDGVSGCTGTVAAGTCSMKFTTVGSRSLTATYAGDSNFNGSSSAGASHTVNKADQSITVTAHAPVDGTYNSSFNVEATSDSGLGVEITASGVCSGSGTGSAGILMTSGTGTCTVHYNQAGDDNYNAAPEVTETTTAQKASTTTSITSDTPDPSTVGESVTVNFSVTSTGGTPTGNVTVSDGTDSCSADVTTGTCTLTLTTVGARTLTATYDGNDNFNGSTSTGVSHTVKDLFTLTVTGSGIDGGTLTSGTIISATWDGSSTSGDNTESLVEGAGPYVITATAKAGEKVRWTGDCDTMNGNNTATAKCRINTMNGNKMAQALFMHVAPTAPSGLTVTIIKENMVSLSWTDNADNEYGYKIERKKEGGLFAQIRILNSDTVSYTDKVPEPGLSYTYRIRAYNDGGNSGYSNEEAISLATPNAPTQLRAKAISSTEIVLAWKDNSVIEEGFGLQRKTGDCLSSGTFTDVPYSIGADETEQTDGGLLPDTAYSYQLKAYKGVTGSAWSKCYSVSTGKAGTPSSPTGLAARAATADSVNLTWHDNSDDETSFMIYRQVDDGAWTLYYTAPAGQRAYSDTAALNNSSTTKYRYYLKACNADGCSPMTSWAAVPQPAVGVLAAPDTAGITVTWVPAGGAENGHVIYRKTGNCLSTDPWVEVKQTEGTATSYTDVSVTSGTVYSYMVRSMQKSFFHPLATGYSAKSNCSRATAPIVK
jgi:hypothetical protein